MSGPGYQEYPLIAATPVHEAEYKHHLLRLAPISGSSSSAQSAAISEWKRPLKLNRKDWFVIRKKADEEREAIRKLRSGAANGGPGEGGDGDEKDIKMDVVDGSGASQSQQRDDSLIAPVLGPTGGAPRGRGAGVRGGKIKRKTRQVHIAANQAARLLRREEHRPWLLEDANDAGLGERWIGEYEGSAESSSAGGPSTSTAGSTTDGGSTSGLGDYVIFRLSAQPDSDTHAFEVVPCSRTYRFTPRPTYDTLSAEEAAEVYEKMQKASTRDDVGRWYMRQRAGASASSSNSAAANGAQAKREGSVKPPPGLSRHQSRPQVPDRVVNGRRFRAVDAGQSRSRELFGDEDDEDVKPKIGGRGGGGAEGEFDEFDYDEDFADDEEGAGNLNEEAMEEDELRELEERLKKEMLNAGRAGDDERMDEGRAHDEDDILPPGGAEELSREGKVTRKLLKKKTKDDVYDSDDSAKNPYASEESSSEPEFSDSDPSPSSKPPSVAGAPTSRSGTPGLSSSAHLAASVSRPSHLRAGSSSRSARPTAANSRSGTPAPGSARGASPRPSGSGGRTASRSGTPQPGGGSRRESRGVSPAPGSGQKRRLDPSAPGSSRDAKRGPSMAGLPPPDQGTGLIQEHEVVAFLKDRVVSTKDLLGHFKLRLKDERNKSIIQSIVRKVGQMIDGNVTLKEGYVP